MSKKIHFMGIGGSGISGAALLAKNMGYEVTGCDLEEKTAYMHEVREENIKVHKGHDKKHLEGVDLLVTVPSVFFQDEKEEELSFAEDKGNLMTWQEFVGEYLHKEKDVIAIAGTHGKSTITALTSLVFEEAGRDPSAIIGAIVREWNKNYRYGKGDVFITEADEFFNNFLNYQPETEVITNIEFDHPDFFRDKDHVFDSFEKFARNLKGKKNFIVNQDSPGIKKLLGILGDEFLTNINLFGYSSKDSPLFEVKNSLVVEKINKKKDKTVFATNSTSWGKSEYTLSVPGSHNVSNAAAVILLSKIYGIKDEALSKVFRDFEGVGRRMELIGEKDGIKVYDDYAHHPTAIKETLSALRQRYKDKRVWAVVEAHSYSRTKALLNEYEGVFEDADKVIIGPIFKARDTETFGISEKSIAEVSGHKDAHATGDLEEVYSLLKENLKEEDVVLVMGAGKSYQWSRKIFKNI